LHDKGSLAVRLRQQSGSWRYHPTTYLVPEEAAKYEAEAAQFPDLFWIRKQRSAFGGSGTRIFRGGQGVKAGESGIVQRYLAHPLLINGHKFSVRLYAAVVVTEGGQLRVYLYDEGLLCLATRMIIFNQFNVDNQYGSLSVGNTEITPYSGTEISEV